MMDEYNLYATSEKDYPIRQFHHKETRLDNAVGYQKTALVFHMLRQELGDDVFFKGIRKIIQEGTGRHVEWEDLERMFSQVGKQPLTEFFNQWIERAGAPSLSLKDLLIQPNPPGESEAFLSGTISQKGKPYQVSLPIHVNFSNGSIFKTNLKLNQANQPFKMKVPGRPTSITLDPEYHRLLRLQRAQLPPMLNSWDTDVRRILVHAATTTNEEKASLKALMHRIQAQPNIEIHQTDSPKITESASYLIIGAPARELLESQALQGCHQNVQMKSERMTILNQIFDNHDMAFLITCPHPSDPNHTISLFFGLSPKAVAPVARLLFFYGWDSYLVFQQGKVIARGMFQPVHSARKFIIPTPETTNLLK